MMILQVFLLCILTLAANFARAGTQASLVTDNAMRLTLTREGFQTLSQTLSKTALKDINNQPVANFVEDLGSGVHGSFSGISFSADFGAMQIVPEQDRLILDIDVEHVQLNIDRARFYKKVIFEISTTCQNTVATIGGATPVHLQVQLEPRVVNGRVE